MNFPSLGDASLQFRLSRSTGSLKTDLSRLSAELSSGIVADKSRAMGGDTARLSGIEHSLSVLQGFRQTTQETALTLTATQTALAAFDSKRSALASDLLKITRESPPLQVDEFARQAESTFGDMVKILNSRFADRTVFGGADVTSPALAESEVMLTDMQARLGPSPLISDVTAVVDAWFDDPAGGFATLGYLGDTGDSQVRKLNEVTSVQLAARADDVALRDSLKAAALAAISADHPGLATRDKASLLLESGARLQSAASQIVQIQARVGFTEQTVERVAVENAARATAISIQRNDLIGADPFDTATALQSLQTQLEMHFTMTARLSRLSLAEYI